MSLTLKSTFTLRCDAGCQREVVVNIEGRPTDVAAGVIRRNAKDNGWHIKNHREICPECWEAGKR